MLKKYLGGFFWAPVSHKRYQNTSGFTGGCFENVLFSDTEKSTAVGQRFYVKKFLDSMIVAFLIVLPFFKNNYRPASDMACFIDI